MKGNHGYDNELKSMRPIFYAKGPDFKVNFTIDVIFESVNIYPLICQLLHINQSSNNGSIQNLAHILKSNKHMKSLETMQSIESTLSLWFFLVFIVLVVISLLFLIINRFKFNNSKTIGNLMTFP